METRKITKFQTYADWRFYLTQTGLALAYKNWEDHLGAPRTFGLTRDATFTFNLYGVVIRYLG